MNNSLWQSVLGEIELSVSHANFKTWFRDTELLSYDNGTATIGVVNVFAKSQLEKRFDTQIREILKKNNPNIKDVNYKVKNTKKKITSRETTASLRDRANELISRAPVNAKTPTANTTLNPRYTFDNFVVDFLSQIDVPLVDEPLLDLRELFRERAHYGGQLVLFLHVLDHVLVHVLVYSDRKSVV